MANPGSEAELVPPQALDVEQAVLGALLFDGKAIERIADILKPEHFYRKSNRQIYEAILALYEREEPVDLITVSEMLVVQKSLEDVGGRGVLLELAATVATSANIEYHAKIIVDKAVLRQLVHSCTVTIRDCYDPSAESDIVLEHAEQAVFAIFQGGMLEDFSLLGDLLPNTFAEIEEFHRRGGGITGLPSGFAELDAITSGLHRGELIIVAGRPSMGKTAFALNMAEHVAVSKDTPVGIFSLEMSKEQVALRMLCSLARVNSHALRTGRLRNEEWPRLSAATGPLSEKKVYIDDSASLSALEIRAKARRLKAKYGVGIIFVDYLQMMRGPIRAENRQQEISLISRSLKALAKELNIPVVALSQLSRGPELRGGDRRPQLSDLRESGAIEQDADVVIFIYRPERYDIKKDSDGRSVENIAEVIVSKQRNGPTGTVRLAFLKEYVRFENLAPDRRTPEPVGPVAAIEPETPF